MPGPYASTVITDTIGTGDVLAGKQVRDVTPGLFQIVDQNHLAPWVAVQTKAMKKGRVATNPKVEFTTKDIFPHWTTVTVGAIAGTSLAITVADGSICKVGDEVEFPQMVPSATQTKHGYISIVSTNAITVQPVGFQADGTTAATFPAATAGMDVQVLGDASDEYSTMPSSKVVKDAQDFNYVQFMRVNYIIGNIQQDQKNYTGPERAERRTETFMEIKMELERVIHFGRRYYATGTTGRKYFMNGLHYILDNAAGDNILDWSGGLTEAQLDEYLMEGPCKWGSQQKYWFMSTDLFLMVNAIGKNKERIINVGVNKLGLAVKQYQAPNGKILHMHQHYMYEVGHEGEGLIVDPAYAELRPYGTQGVIKLHEEIQANDAAGIADEWRVLCTLIASRTEPHGRQHQ